jgi:chromosomal replication initiation ATPase DnaA
MLIIPPTAHRLIAEAKHLIQQANGASVMLLTIDLSPAIVNPQSVFDMLLATVIKYFGITEADFYSKSREGVLPIARQCFIYSAIGSGFHSVSSLAKKLPWNHQVISYANRQATDLYSTDRYFINAVAACSAAIQTLKQQAQP